MRIAHISDTHMMITSDDELLGRARAENLSAAVARINALTPAVDAVIHTGDVAQNRKAGEYALAREILSDLAQPVYVVAGNRDCRASLRRTFAPDGYMTGEGDAAILYAIDDLPVRLIGFDSQSDDQRKGDLDPTRLRWLDATLAQAPDAPSAILMHHPPIPINTSEFPWQWQRDDVGSELAAVLTRHPQAVQIFCGHSHRAYHDNFGDVLVSTTPSIAVDLRLGDFAPEAEDQPVFHLHTFEPGSGFTSASSIAAFQTAKAAE